MGKKLDLIGKKFNMLTVMAKGETKGKNAYWICKCDCGVVKSFSSTDLTIKNAKSCGCSQYDRKSTNEYLFFDDYVVINIMSKKYGEVKCYIDKEDYDLIKDYTWSVNSKMHISSNDNKTKGLKFIFIDRLIMNCCNTQQNLIIDHIDGNPLTNRKNNLRFATNQQNSRNSKIRTKNISGCTGVTWYQDRTQWIAKIGVDGKNIYLGAFDNKEDAIQCRHDAEIKYFGEFSPLVCRQGDKLKQSEL